MSVSVRKREKNARPKRPPSARLTKIEREPKKMKNSIGRPKSTGTSSMRKIWKDKRRLKSKKSKIWHKKREID